jgi:hypothetical protein
LYTYSDLCVLSTSLDTNICQVSSLILFPLYINVSQLVSSFQIPRHKFVCIGPISFSPCVSSYHLSAVITQIFLFTFMEPGRPTSKKYEIKKLGLLTKKNIQKFKHLLLIHLIVLVFSTTHPMVRKFPDFIALKLYRFCFFDPVPLSFGD